MKEYRRLKNKAFDFDDLLETNPELAKVISDNIDQWSMYEQLPDLSEIPAEYQHMIPENIRKNQEDTRIQHIMLTKW